MQMIYTTYTHFFMHYHCTCIDFTYTHFAFVRFIRSRYGCSGGFVQGQMQAGWNNVTDNRTLAMNCSYQGLPYNCPRDCTDAVRAAIAAAGAEPNSAGGVVYLGPGRWYLRAPFLLPDNVVLRGAGAAQTGVVLAFENKTTAPKQIIGAASGTAQGVRFAVEDITFWHTTYYNTFVDISSNTDGVRIRNVHIRANMFTWAWDTEGSDSKSENVRASLDTALLFDNRHTVI